MEGKNKLSGIMNIFYKCLARTYDQVNFHYCLFPDFTPETLKEAYEFAKAMPDEIDKAGGDLKLAKMCLKNLEDHIESEIGINYGSGLFIESFDFKNL